MVLAALYLVCGKKKRANYPEASSSPAPKASDKTIKLNPIKRSCCGWSLVAQGSGEAGKAGFAGEGREPVAYVGWLLAQHSECGQERGTKRHICPVPRLWYSM